MILNWKNRYRDAPDNCYTKRGRFYAEVKPLGFTTHKGHNYEYTVQIGGVTYYYNRRETLEDAQEAVVIHAKAYQNKLRQEAENWGFVTIIADNDGE